MMLTLACKKRWFDYRNKYQGDWTFNYKIITCDVVGTCDTLIGQHKGRIFYDNQTMLRDEMEMEYTPELSRRFAINEDGLYKNCELHGGFKGSLRMYMEQDDARTCGTGKSKGTFTIEANQN
jgi:hypothetical protein